MREIDESVETTRTEWDGLTMEDLEIPAIDCPAWFKYVVWGMLLAGGIGLLLIILAIVL